MVVFNEIVEHIRFVSLMVTDLFLFFVEVMIAVIFMHVWNAANTSTVTFVNYLEQKKGRERENNSIA